MNTLNVYGRGRESLDYGTRPLWLEVRETWPCGCSIDIQPGQLIPAGTPVIIEPGHLSGGKCHVYDPSTDDAGDVTGLIWNDVYCDPTTENPTATCALVTRGMVMADRLPFDSLDTATYGDLLNSLKERILFTWERTENIY